MVDAYEACIVTARESAFSAMGVMVVFTSLIKPGYQTMITLELQNTKLAHYK